MTPRCPTYTTIDLPTTPEGFEEIAHAADDAMWDTLTRDFVGHTELSEFLDLSPEDIA
jgi:hypothetical protein